MALFLDRVQLPQGYRATMRRQFILTTCFQKVLVLIRLTWEGWKAELILEPPSGFEHEMHKPLDHFPLTTKLLIHNLSKLSTSIMIQAWHYRGSSLGNFYQLWRCWSVKFTYIYIYIYMYIYVYIYMTAIMMVF